MATEQRYTAGYKSKNQNKRSFQSIKSSAIFVNLQDNFFHHISAETSSFILLPNGDICKVATLMKNKKMGKASCIVVHFLPTYLFLYLQLRVRCWQNNPASVSFRNSTIIQERQFIIRVPLSRHQPSQLGPLRLPVSQPVRDSSTSLLFGLESWRHRPNPNTPHQHHLTAEGKEVTVMTHHSGSNALRFVTVME